MEQIELKLVKHNVKLSDECGRIQPNVTKDSMFVIDGQLIGFYLKDIKQHSTKLASLIAIANQEFRSKAVPKSVMRRASGLNNPDNEVRQYSTIIGSIRPNARMQRPYPTISSVHNVPSAKTFIKAMLLACHESEEVIKNLAPEIFKKQLKIIKDRVPAKYRFGRMFTSSISNYNIAAQFHQDSKNIPDCVNVIISKKLNARGGNLHVPDYDATFDCSENSMIVYPAWR